MKLNRETLDSYKIDLVQTKYMTEYWDGKKSDLACTVYGMDRLLVWMQITDEVKNIEFQANAPLITTEKKQYILTEFIGEKFVTRIFKEGREEISGQGVSVTEQSSVIGTDAHRTQATNENRHLWCR